MAADKGHASLDTRRVLCVDVEASGLAAGSFPIEVAIAVVVTGEVKSWLIRPDPGWLTHGIWDPAAEAIHGLTIARLEQEGVSPVTVVGELTDCLWGASVFSDNPHHDEAWLRMLYRVVGATRPPADIQPFRDFVIDLAEGSSRNPQQTIAEAEAAAWAAIPEQHRAAPDARRNALILRRLAALTQVLGCNSSPRRGCPPG